MEQMRPSRAAKQLGDLHTLGPNDMRYADAPKSRRTAGSHSPVIVNSRPSRAPHAIASIVIGADTASVENAERP